MKLLLIITYAVILIFLLFFVYKRLSDINIRNIENIGCKYLKKRNNMIFVVISMLLIVLFLSGSFVIITLI